LGVALFGTTSVLVREAPVRSPVLGILSCEFGRGWYTDETATQTLFFNGTGAGLRQWPLYGDAGKKSPPSQIQRLYANHPLLISGGLNNEQLETNPYEFLGSALPKFTGSILQLETFTGGPGLIPNVVPNNATKVRFFQAHALSSYEEKPE